MPALTPPDQTTIDSWRIDERGVDGSSPKVTFDRTGSIATRQVLCAWEYRYDVARWFVGESQIWQDGDVSRLSRLVPQKLPRPAGLPEWVPDFWASKIVEITGHCWDGNDPDDWARMERDESGRPMSPVVDPAPEYQFTEDTVNKFTDALVTIQYERFPFEVRADDEVEEGEYQRWTQYLTKPSAPEYITVPSSVQNYLDPAGVGPNNPVGHRVPVPYPVGLVESSYRFALKWHRLPYGAWGPGTALFTKIMGDGTPGSTYLNAVNNEVFYSMFEGTLMLEEVTDELVPVILDQGLMNWDLTFHFWYKPGGHNSQWFFPNSNEQTASGNLMKRMFVGRGSTYYPPGSVPDLVANYCEKDMAELFIVGD